MPMESLVFRSAPVGSRCDIAVMFGGLRIKVWIIVRLDAWRMVGWWLRGGTVLGRQSRTDRRRCE